MSDDVPGYILIFTVMYNPGRIIDSVIRCMRVTRQGCNPDPKADMHFHPKAPSFTTITPEKKIH